MPATPLSQDRLSSMGALLRPRIIVLVVGVDSPRLDHVLRAELRAA
jgi:hypothetical protein